MIGGDVPIHVKIWRIPTPLQTLDFQSISLVESQSQGRLFYGGNDARCVIEISGGGKEKNCLKFCIM